MQKSQTTNTELKHPLGWDVLSSVFVTCEFRVLLYNIMFLVFRFCVRISEIDLNFSLHSVQTTVLAVVKKRITTFVFSTLVTNCK